MVKSCQITAVHLGNWWQSQQTGHAPLGWLRLWPYRANRKLLAQCKQRGNEWRASDSISVLLMLLSMWYFMLKIAKTYGLASALFLTSTDPCHFFHLIILSSLLGFVWTLRTLKPPVLSACWCIFPVQMANHEVQFVGSARISPWSPHGLPMVSPWYPHGHQDTATSCRGLLNDLSMVHRMWAALLPQVGPESNNPNLRSHAAWMATTHKNVTSLESENLGYLG